MPIGQSAEIFCFFWPSLPSFSPFEFSCFVFSLEYNKCFSALVPYTEDGGSKLNWTLPNHSGIEMGTWFLSELGDRKSDQMWDRPYQAFSVPTDQRKLWTLNVNGLRPGRLTSEGNCVSAPRLSTRHTRLRLGVFL